VVKQEPRDRGTERLLLGQFRVPIII
jgi:hypothetical protein